MVQKDKIEVDINLNSQQIWQTLGYLT